MAGRMATTFKFREKIKALIRDKEPEEIPPPYVPVYPSLPPTPSSTLSPLTSDREA
jgi:hypothetical protein